MLGKRNGLKVFKLMGHKEDEPSYFCRIYKCGKKSIDPTGYCDNHKSPLRTGKPPLTPGSAPIIRKTTI